MRLISLKLPETKAGMKKLESYLLGVIIFLVWYTAPKLLAVFDSTIGVIDQSIWMLVLLSMISFMLTVGTAWWLLKWCWKALGLPSINIMVLHFKELELWQQLGFYYASFSLLLLAAIGALAAVL
ncbi:putative membrane protein YkgB [Pedobacter sp. UYP24]